MKEFIYFSFVSIIACVLCVCSKTWGANILYMSTAASVSHNMWDKTLAIALRNRGHRITFVSLLPEKSTDNFTAIFFEGVHEEMLKIFDLEASVNLDARGNVPCLLEWNYMSCELAFKTKGIQQVLKLAKKGKKFDLIIQDVAVGLCYSPIVELFGFPLIVGTSPLGIQPFIAYNFGIDLQTSYVPHYAVYYTEKMSFSERMYNYFIQMYEVSWKYYYGRKIKKLLDEFYGRDMKHIYEIERNFSILLANYDPILDYPRPLPPDVIPVGGLHIKTAKTLPQDLQKYLDNSKNGVIIFSLGTNIRSDKLKEEKKKVLLETFAQLKQNVIWKFESDISDLPKNVIVRRYLPQNDILGHPKVKLLINHGGALSSQEAIYHGVPLITMPFYIDQRTISHKISNRKLGLSLKYTNLTVNDMLTTIIEVLNNPIYAQNAKKLSQTFQDRPDSPLDRAVFWVEHVIRQGGAQHLNLVTRQMPLYQIQLLDIWFLIIATLIIGVFLIKNICCMFLFTHKSSEETKIKSN